jgi:Beta-1,3-glucanase
MTPTRRTVLGWAAAALTAAPLLDLAASGPAAAATSLPITVVNNTGGYANSSIWLYVVGTDPATGNQAYVRGDGTLVDVSLSLNGSDGYADLSIPLAGSGNTGLNLPNMSGRIYFSIGDKLKFKVVTDGNGHPALQYPAGWVSSDPSYNVLHDCVEFTFNGSGMFCNTTMVDMFSIPLALTLTGAAQQTTGTLKSGGRSAIFSGIAAEPDFARLVIGDDLRVIAPGHGIDAGLFSGTYYDGYVDQVWSTYGGQDLTVSANGTSYTGRVSGGTLNFSGGPAPFAKPSTQNIFYCNGALSAPNDGVTGPVAAVLGAAFNRSTLNAYPNEPVTDPSLFYQQATTNHYSRVIHANTADGKAYGFPFDDVAGFASYIQDTAPSALTITLTAF